MDSLKTRLISLCLCLSMILGLVPALSISAGAAASGEPSKNYVTGSPRDLNALSSLRSRIDSIYVDTSFLESVLSAAKTISLAVGSNYGVSASTLASYGLSWVLDDLDSQISYNFFLLCEMFVNMCSLKSVFSFSDYSSLRDCCFKWTSALSSFRNSVDYQIETAHPWADGSLSDAVMNSFLTDYWDIVFSQFPKTVNVIWDSSISGYRLYFPGWDLYFCTGYGNYLFYIPVDESSDANNGVDQSDPDSYSSDQWRDESVVTEVSSADYRWHFISYSELSGKLQEWANAAAGNASIWDYGDFWCLRMQVTGAKKTINRVLCDELGQPYYVPDPSVTAASNRTDNINSVTGQINPNLLLDLENRLSAIEDQMAVLGNVTYDPDSRTYYVEANTDYTFNTTNNYYEYYTYYYTFNFYYEYTYITNIGTTGQYQDETYTYYYQLPDGRSSADLTAEELAQLNVFMDVVGYVASTDDTRLRALYHFDGNIEDSSFWAAHDTTGFEWLENASVTYLDSGAFNGCLYLDALSHKFQVDLPGAIGNGDFTLSFRLYQQAEPLDGSTGYIQIGSDGLNASFQAITFDGTNYYMGDTTVSTPGGTWTEILVQRISGTIYYYLNGLRVSTCECSNAFDSTLVFYFPADTGGYHYIDELRVLNYALHSSLTVQYATASVPYDSNSALVLPDSAVPVADEYWSITSSKTNLLADAGLDWWTSNRAESGLFSSNFYTYSTTVATSSWTTLVYQNGERLYSRSTIRYRSPYWFGSDFSSYCFPVFTADTTFIDSFCVDATSFNLKSDSFFDAYGSSSNNVPFVLPAGTIASCLGAIDVSTYSSSESNFLPDGVYTFSMVDADGIVGSYTFDFELDVSKFTSLYSSLYSGVSFGNVVFSDELIFNGYAIRLCYVVNQYYDSGASYYAFLTVAPIYGAPAGEFVYLELCEGSSTDLEAEFVSSVVALDADDLRSPTLAVRYNYQLLSGTFNIGGIRPTLPSKGDVWCLVESGFITSIQVYTGYAWESCDGRIWTGSRWIPYNAYNVITQADLWDITDGTSGKTYIYTSEGFWSWFEECWRAFIELFTSDLNQILVYLSSLVDSAGSGSGSSSGSDSGSDSSSGTLDPDDFPVDSTSPDSDESYTVFDLIGVLVDGSWRVVTGIVRVGVDGFSSFTSMIGNIGSFFDVFDRDNTSGVFYVELEGSP